MQVLLTPTQIPNTGNESPSPFYSLIHWMVHFDNGEKWRQRGEGRKYRIPAR